MSGESQIRVNANIITFPDVNANSNVILSEGNQTIGGTKTFSNKINTDISGTATTLETTRTLWGQNFNGSADVSGNLTSVGNITGSGAITVTAGGTNQNITLTPSGTGVVNASTSLSEGGTALTTKYVQTGAVNQTIGGTKTFSNTITGSVSGNAGTATTLQTARTIAISGGATGTATSFNGGANITIPVTGLNADNLNSGTVPDARLTGTYTGVNISGNAGTATTLETTRTLWGQNFNGSTDVSGNLTSVGNITGTGAITVAAGGTNQNITLTPSGTGVVNASTSLSEGGTALTTKYVQTGAVNQTIGGTKTFSNTITGSVSGNAGTASLLQTARTIAISGGATGTATSFNGGANITIPVTGLNADNLNAGTVPDARLSGTYTGVNISGNAGTATTLETTRTLWGQNFNGSANVTGNLTSVGNITGTGAITVAAGGTNQNVTIQPSGTGTFYIDNGTFQLQKTSNGYASTSDILFGISIVNTTTTVTWYKIAQLPVTSGGQFNHIVINCNFGGWNSTNQTYSQLIFRNRDTFSARYQASDTIRNASAIECYNDSGLIEIYVKNNLQFSATTYNIVDSLEATIFNPPVSQTTTPTGTLVFSTATSVPDLIVNNSGNLGIGIATPSEKLSVSGNIQLGTQTNKATITYPTNTARTYTLPDAGANADFVMTAGNQTIGGTKTFSSTITGSVSGNAGTATTLATTRTLWGQNFNGSANVTGNLTSVGNITGTSAITVTAGGTNQNITLTPSGTGTVNAPTFNATSTTNGGFQGIDADTAALPSFTWSGDLNTGMYHPAADTIGLTTAGTERLRVGSTGNIGINNTTLESRLNINENIAHDNNFNYSTAQLTIFDPNNNGGNVPNGTRDSLYLVREGIASEAYGNKVAFAIGRYENVGTDSRTQLDIKLNDGNFTTDYNVLSLRSNGQVNIGTGTVKPLIIIDSTNSGGVAAPTFTTRSNGTKLVLYPAVSGTLVDYGIGIEGSNMWHSVSANTTTQGFKWYGGITEVARLDGIGNLSVNGAITEGGTALTTKYVQTGAVNQTIGGTKTFSNTITGSVSGNAGTASLLQTARTIAISGGATGTATSFNGGANITIPVTGLNADNLNAGTVPDARLSGTYTGVNISGNAGTASLLQTARTIAISGGATGTATSFNGGSNITIPVTGLNASNLDSGTVPDARLSGTYSGFTHKMDGTNTVFTTPNSGTSSTVARTVYGLAEYRSNSTAQTGAIVFIQSTTASSIMYQLEIAGLQYSTARITKITVQGYRTTGAWSLTDKISTGEQDVDARWAVDPTGKNCLILGDVGTVWSFPHFSIVRAMFSHNGATDTICTGWTVGVVTDLTGYTNITAVLPNSSLSTSITGNSGTSTTLATTRTLWGQNFNGSANVTGNLTSVGNITGTGAITVTAGGTNQNITLTPSGTGTVNAPTFNATSTTNGGFQGIDADTAAIPSFTWTADLNTGMYHPAADTIGFTTGGTERLRIANTVISSAQAQLQITKANNTADGGGQIYLNGATGNRIDFNTNGAAAPAFTTRSAGTKLVLYPFVSGTTTDFGLGIETDNMWFSTGSNTAPRGFKWYGGTTEVAKLDGTGLFNARNLFLENSSGEDRLRTIQEVNAAVTRSWKRIATVNNNNGMISIKGVLGGHDFSSAGQGQSWIDLGFSLRGSFGESGAGFKVFGTAGGRLGGGGLTGSADLLVILNNSSTTATELYVYLERANYTQYQFTLQGSGNNVLLEDGAWSTLNPESVNPWFSPFRLSNYLNDPNGGGIWGTTITFNGTPQNIIRLDNNSVSIGNTNALFSQNVECVAIGYNSGANNQSFNSVAIGSNAGNSDQGGYSVAIGNYAGNNSQSLEAIAIGTNAGQAGQGAGSIAIGGYAGQTNQHANSIILNATGTALNSDGTSRFYVDPIRTSSNDQLLLYNPTTKEITYGTTLTTNTLSAPTFNATSTTNGGFQGIDADTAALPSFTWSGDLNTGMYRPAADTIGFTTGGTERLRIANTVISSAQAQLQITKANNTATGGGQIYLNGATGNRIDFNQNGVAAPAFTTRSVGTKLNLYPGVSGSATDFAIGIENSYMWYSVSNNNTTQGFKWYGATTQAAKLDGVGNLSVSSSFQGVSADTSTTPSYTWVGDTQTGMYHPQSGNIGFTNNGTDTLQLKATDPLNDLPPFIYTSTAQIRTEKDNNVGTGLGQIYLNGNNGNRIDFNTAGIDFPKFTTRSVGTKIVIYPQVTSNSVDYAIGLEGAGMWFSIPQAISSHFYKWYGGQTVRMTLTGNGNLNVAGALSKGSGSFKIDHPLPEKKDTHHLVHSFIEGPRADLIYRGRADLVNGEAFVNIDESAGMTEGTFVALCRDIQCFVSNETDWDAVKGKVTGNQLHIRCQNPQSTATVSWLVIGERQDKHMFDTDWTDDNGRVIVEPLKTQPDTSNQPSTQ